MWPSQAACVGCLNQAQAPAPWMVATNLTPITNDTLLSDADMAQPKRHHPLTVYYRVSALCVTQGLCNPPSTTRPGPQQLRLSTHACMSSLRETTCDRSALQLATRLHLR